MNRIYTKKTNRGLAIVETLLIIAVILLIIAFFSRWGRSGTVYRYNTNSRGQSTVVTPNSSTTYTTTTTIPSSTTTYTNTYQDTTYQPVQ